MLIILPTIPEGEDDAVRLNGDTDAVGTRAGKLNVHLDSAAH